MKFQCPGGLFWQRKNLGRAIRAAEKLWPGYFGRGKIWAGDILAAAKTMRRRTFWKFYIQILCY